jgi:hypothetical protein
MDTTGTLYSMARFAGVMNERTADFENSTIAYCVDAFSISIGALFGTSPVTAFIESATVSDLSVPPLVQPYSCRSVGYFRRWQDRFDGHG